MKPGDVLLVSGHSIEDWAIRLAQERRDGKQALWSHVALIVAVTDGGQIIEAAGTHGVRRNTVSAYSHVKTAILPITATDEQRAAAIAFAESQLGHRYDFADLAFVGLNLLLNDPISCQINGTWICSQLVAEALERAGYTWDRDPSDISPGDLAVLLTPNPTGPATEANMSHGASGSRE